MIEAILTVLADVGSTGEGDSWWYFGLWGLLGGVVADGLNYARVLQLPRTKPMSKNPPGGVSLLREDILSLPYAIGCVIRISIGCILAICMALSGQISGAMGGLVVGITAPAIVDRIIRQGHKSNGMSTRGSGDTGNEKK